MNRYRIEEMKKCGDVMAGLNLVISLKKRSCLQPHVSDELNTRRRYGEDQYVRD